MPFRYGKQRQMSKRLSLTGVRGSKTLSARSAELQASGSAADPARTLDRNGGGLRRSHRRAQRHRGRSPGGGFGATAGSVARHRDSHGGAAATRRLRVHATVPLNLPHRQRDAPSRGLAAAPRRCGGVPAQSRSARGDCADGCGRHRTPCQPGNPRCVQTVCRRTWLNLDKAPATEQTEPGRPAEVHLLGSIEASVKAPASRQSESPALAACGFGR